MERVEQLKIIQDEARALFKQKNADYGDAFATYGIVGVLIRIQDKINRFINVSKKGLELVKDETIRDTLLDLHNYSAMGIMMNESTGSEVLIKKLSSDAITPTRGTSGSVGYDMYSSVDTHVEPRERALVSTGIAMTVPSGTYGRIAPRSGLAVKYGIQVGAGVIDPDYTGEVKVLLFNDGDKMVEIKKGDRIAQLVIERCETPGVKIVTELGDTARGIGGFGSTGC